MNRQTRLPGLLGLVAAGTFGLTACGGGSSGGGMSQMTLAVGDAPVDGAQAVVVKFTGVELVPNSGNPVDVTFTAPKTIDLLNESGTASAVLFSQPIPAGDYGQIRLMVAADGNPSNSYITLSDGTMHGLQVPSGSETGLKLVTGFTVPSSGVVDYSIDFDLRKQKISPRNGDVVEAGIIDEGGGWYRIWAAMPFDAAPAVFNLALMDLDKPTYQGDGVSGVFVRECALSCGERPAELMGVGTTIGQAHVLETVWESARG